MTNYFENPTYEDLKNWFLSEGYELNRRGGKYWARRLGQKTAEILIGTSLVEVVEFYNLGMGGKDE